MKISMQMPFPPSLNHYYRTYRGRTAISEAGRRYRADVLRAFRSARFTRQIKGDALLTVEAYPPDRRRRDLDNLMKCLLDTLTACGVWGDDSQVKEIHAYMREPVPGGMCYITAEDLPKC